jgi:RNA polymerase sigma factor (sigma-70 family)
MCHELDAADARMLAAGEHAFLLAKYEPVIIGRCIAKLRGHADADDVAQDVKLRLWRGLVAGKEYAVPFRVVVHQVIGWTIGDYFEGRPTDVPLPDGWDAGDPSDPHGELLDRDAVTSMLDGLEGRTREVMELRYLELLDPDQIAERLGMKRNAIDQALHRGHHKLRETATRG